MKNIHSRLVVKQDPCVGNSGAIIIAIAIEYNFTLSRVLSIVDEREPGLVVKLSRSHAGCE